MFPEKLADSDSKAKRIEARDTIWKMVAGVLAPTPFLWIMVSTVGGWWWLLAGGWAVVGLLAIGSTVWTEARGVRGKVG